MTDIKSILEYILTKFPELRSKDIQIEWTESEESLLSVQELDPEGWIIEVDKDLENAKEAVIRGGIAHELCHILTDLKWKNSSRLLDRLLYKISRRYEILDERNTDLETILRGFGPELLAFMVESEKAGLDFHEEDGLSIRELKALLHL